MHALACRSLRLTCRAQARIIAGRRHAPRFRAFHRSTITLQASDPALPEDSSNPIDPGRAVDERENVNEEACEPAEPAPLPETASTEETPPALLERLRNGRKRINNPDRATPYGSGIKRSQRNREFRDLPAITVPEWFLRRNVILREQLDGDAVSALRRTDGEHTSRSHIDQEDVTDAESGLEGGKDERYHIDKAIMQEIESAVIVGLATATPDLSMSIPAAKANIQLHCPLDGGIYFLDKVVEDAASAAGADVIILDAQDFAELGAECMKGDAVELTTQGIRSIGHKVYSVANFKDAEEFDEDDAPNEDDDLEGDDSLTSVRATVRAMHRRGRDEARKMARELTASITGRHAFIVGEPFIYTGGTKQQEPDDLKMGALLEALLETAHLKRARSNAPCPSDMPDKNSFVEANSELPGQASDMGMRKLVILIRDYKELNAQKEGGKILDQLLRIVQRRRSEGQQMIIVGTTSSANLTPEHTKSGIREMQLSGNDTHFRNIFVVPSDIPGPGTEVFESDKRRRIRELNTRLLQDMVRQMDPTEITFSNADNVAQRIREGLTSIGVNSTTEIDDDQDLAEDDEPTDDDFAASSSDVGTKLGERLERSVWPFNSVHRIVTTALSLKLKAKEHLSVDHIVSAMLIIYSSDDAKYRSAKTQVPNEEGDAAGSEAFFPMPHPRFKQEDRLKRLRRTATHHEKKLLSGVIKPDAITTGFSDVHAKPETVEALKTLTTLNLIRPDAFKYGVLATDKIPGLLLYGPPGTGKTLLAKAVAKESGATMLEVSGSEVYDMYVGEGEKNVKAVFSLAKKLSPCVVFIDEADAIFGSRGGGQGQRTSHRELINQFLREWDGMSEMGAFIMVATNRPFDLDDAVLRRLPRRLLVDLPVEKDRESILKIHLKDEELGPEVRLSELASQTPLYSGSDLKNLAVATALACVREEYEEAAKQRASTSSPSSDFIFPEKRILRKRHFDKAMEEISASISEDMSSLSAIKKFDEKYGDRRGRRKRSGYGFGVGGQDQAVVESDARVRV